MSLVKHTEHKVGGWVGLHTRIGPLRRTRTVAYRDRSRQHNWSWQIGRLSLHEPFPGGPRELKWHGDRVEWTMTLRKWR